MGQQQSKDELLYQQVNYGNIEGIKALRSDGAGLEWMDSEGKTPLIVACMNPQLINVAKTLIELGANVDAYRPGRHAGTPLHHAAKRGLEQTVKLLLSHGANALVMNDDCQTPLDVARIKGFSNVVRAIESHICLFSGWLRELYGPGFLDLLAPQLLSRKVWVVVLPCGSRNLRKPFKLELAMYASAQDAQPRTIVALWKANLEEPNFSQSDPIVIISDVSNKVRVKLGAVQESEKQQLQLFCNACKGIPQVTHSAFPFNPQAPVLPATAPPALEDLELAMALSASMQPATHERPPLLNTHTGPGAVASTSHTNPVILTVQTNTSDLVTSTPQKGSGEFEKAGPCSNEIQHSQASVIQTMVESPVPPPIPSAPTITDEEMDDGPIHYPSIDATPVDLSSQPVENVAAKPHEDKDQSDASSCVVCLDAPAEGACIPCGHMAGCMSCLAEIKAKKWGCPVCRAKIDQVIRVYAV
ncbi:PREDICTED: putative E3 ubiquitin-protein ligase XBAT35 isoform X2 [Ipomoea nil]|uniref:putative E3 ubiquitin-protein ligase XBAT35 isoform X2 n=1 Tax=Ipomoea nil TaxID=35883 RepID=UPI000901BCE5|nr:PREDICTED: putative E3 ubiquitin-protein ligase XBAT35 isoform X2 [Ipomoea nil]